jgi:general secretion pathway protein D
MRTDTNPKPSRRILTYALRCVVMILLAGCATPTAERPPVRPRPPARAEPPPAVPAPERESPLSVGPRREETVVSPPPPAPRVMAPSPAPAPTAPPTPPGPRRFVMFNFDNADVELVVQAAAEIVGFNYVIAPGARGRKVTVQTTGRISSDEVFPLLLTILDVNGLTAVRSGNLYRIIPKEGAPQTPVKTVVGTEIDPRVPGDESVTQIVPLQYMNATEATALLRPFVAAQGNLSAHRDANLLLITDTAANVRRLLDVLKLADVPAGTEELKIIPIQHADAQELAQLLGQIFATGRARVGPPAAPAPPPAPGAPRPPTPGDPGGPERPLIVAERRSNTLIVQARRQDMETMLRLIGELDVDVYGGQRVFIHFAENAKAKDLAATLEAIYGRGPGVQPARAEPGAPPVAPGLPPPSRPPVGRIPGVEEGPPLGDLRIVPDEITNAIIVTTYPRAWRQIESTIKSLDKTPRQVLIEVFAAEITLADDFRLGVEWAIRTGRFDLVSSPSGQLPSRPITNLHPPFLGNMVPTGFTFYTFATEAFLSSLNALAAENKIDVLASPTVMTAENKKAVINVSTSVPVVTSQQVPIGAGGTTGFAVTQTVQYIDAGVILTVTPRIGEAGTVALDVKQEVNQVGENEPPPINSPRISKREAETSVVLLNNQTLVLGGLIQHRKAATRTGIPVLYKIPIIGYLFGSVTDRTEKTELLLLITPRVVGNPADAARVTEEMTRVTPGMRRAIERAPRPPTTTP